jgi:Spy/CpxP family protein refolding chaperone
MKRSNLIRLASTAAIAAGMAFAQAPSSTAPPAGSSMQAPARTPRAARRAQFRERWMSQLNLTPEQRRDADTIFGKAHKQTGPLVQELRANREALRAAIRSDDTASIHSLSTKQATLVGQMTEIQSSAMAHFYSKLTPAQKAKADQLHQQMRQRIEQRKATGTAS